MVSIIFIRSGEHSDGGARLLIIVHDPRWPRSIHNSNSYIPRRRDQVLGSI